MTTQRNDDLLVFGKRAGEYAARYAQQNSLGTINPVARIADWAHSQGAIYVAELSISVSGRKADAQPGRDLTTVQKLVPAPEGS